MQILSQNLKTLRTVYGLKQKDAARRVFVSRSLWAQYEAQITTPTTDALRRISEAFEVDMDTLVKVRLTVKVA